MLPVKTKQTRVFTALLATLALAFGLAGCGGGSNVDTAAFEGEWTLIGFGDDGEIDADKFALAATLGVNVTLDLKSDGSAVLDMAGDIEEGTWKAVSDSKGSFEADGTAADILLQDGKLILTDGDENLVFMRPGDLPAPEVESEDADSTEGEEGEEGEESEESPAGTSPAVPGEVIVSDEFVTIALQGVTVDGLDDVGYVFEVRNNYDRAIWLNQVVESFSVNGKGMNVGFGETIDPGQSEQVLLTFPADELGGADPSLLVNVKGSIYVLDDETVDVLATIDLELPDGSNLDMVD